MTRTAKAGPADAEHLDSIQILRALAALAVVAYHARQWTTGGFDVGRAGVDVFFVISGFIMWRVTQRREVSPARFLWRRLTRVAPLYWLATLGVAAMAAVWPGFLPEVRPGWRHLVLSLLFIPHLDPRGLPFPTLPPGWTLNYEAVFYLIFACALAAPRAWRASVAIGGLFAATLAGFVLADPVYFLGANPMLLQFAAGVALGWASGKDGLPGRAAGAAMIVAAFVLWVAIAALNLFDERWRPLLWGAPALLLVTGALTLETGAGADVAAPSPLQGWARRGAVRLGDASYAIYLVHLPATAIVAHTLGFGRPWLFLALSMAASILAGLAARRWIELPLVRAVRAISLPAAWTTGSIRYFRRS